MVIVCMLKAVPSKDTKSCTVWQKLISLEQPSPKTNKQTNNKKTSPGEERNQYPELLKMSCFQQEIMRQAKSRNCDQSKQTNTPKARQQKLCQI